VTFGFISPQTGAQSAVFPGAVAGCNAAVGLKNAQGGVNGRKVKVVYGDDQSNFTGLNTTIAEHMVQSQHVFLVVEDSGASFQTYRALEGLGVPMVDDTVGSLFAGDPSNENSVITETGNTNTNANTTYDVDLRVMKAMGATKIATVGAAAIYSPSSHDGTINDANNAAREGLKSVYVDSTIGLSTADLGPVVLGIKNSGADGVVVNFSVASALPIYEGLKQAGVKLKSFVFAQGYGKQMLAGSVAPTLGPEAVFSTQWAPVELNTPATKQFQAALQQYGGLTGIPDYGAYTAFQECDLVMIGLAHAGNPPTRAAFIPGLRALNTINPSGLDCAPLDISTQNYGKSPDKTCSWFLYVQNGHWVPYPNNGSAWVSTVLPGTTPSSTVFAAPAPLGPTN
jgi:branched-chain amino acid transport system substrate-binding protein